MRHVIYDTDNRPKSRRILTYTAGPEDERRPVRDIILYKWKLVAHDVARAKYETPDGITVNGEVVWVNRRLHEGDILRVVITDHAPDSIIPSEGRLDIVYEDEDLICINKPPGIVVHPSHGHYADSLANYLAVSRTRSGRSADWIKILQVFCCSEKAGQQSASWMRRQRRGQEPKCISRSARGNLPNPKDMWIPQS